MTDIVRNLVVNKFIGRSKSKNRFCIMEFGKTSEIYDELYTYKMDLSEVYANQSVIEFIMFIYPLTESHYDIFEETLKYVSAFPNMKRIVIIDWKTELLSKFIRNIPTLSIPIFESGPINPVDDTIMENVYDQMDPRAPSNIVWYVEWKK